MNIYRSSHFVATIQRHIFYANDKTGRENERAEIKRLIDVAGHVYNLERFDSQ